MRSADPLLRLTERDKQSSSTALTAELLVSLQHERLGLGYVTYYQTRTRTMSHFVLSVQSRCCE